MHDSFNCAIRKLMFCHNFFDCNRPVLQHHLPESTASLSSEVTPAGWPDPGPSVVDFPPWRRFALLTISGAWDWTSYWWTFCSPMSFSGCELFLTIQNPIAAFFESHFAEIVNTYLRKNAPTSESLDRFAWDVARKVGRRNTWLYKASLFKLVWKHIRFETFGYLRG